jgi:predicted Holliday junction resolvase-like endonuclease
MNVLEVLLAVVMIVAVVAFLAWPVLHGIDERVIDAERRELEDAKQAKYREIKDAELDRKAGRMTEEQWQQTDRELRREAMQILREIDTLGAERPAAPAA